MADRPIQDLPLATTISNESLFVLQQNNRAWKLRGETFIDYLANRLDAHGGIREIIKLNTVGLVDTYQITYADSSTFTYQVANGRGITSISKISTTGLEDTYRILYNDNTNQSYVVKNGAQGAKGNNAYIYIMYSERQPTDDSDMKGTIDNWIGVAEGQGSIYAPPSHYTSYQWFEMKGEKGDKGDDITVASTLVTYAASDNGQNPPSDPSAWSSNIPIVAQSNFLWTRITVTYSDGISYSSYSVARQGSDGSGSVSSVNGVSPVNGDVSLYSVQGTTLVLNSSNS